jgi:hypothetical protein
MSEPVLSDEEKDILAAIGVALLLIQATEQLLRLCITLVLQKQMPLTLEALEQQERAERKKTLGYFITELRKRANLQENLDVLLDEFLEDRNTFVHHLPGWNIRTEAGRVACSAFIGKLIQMAWTIMNVLLGLIRAWQLQVSFPEMPELATHFPGVDNVYAPLADYFFRLKT